MKTRIVVTGALLLSTVAANSQSFTPTVVNAGGKTFTNDSLSLEWSIGEVALVNTMEASNGKFIVSNGFQQPDLSYKDDYKPSFTSNEITVLPSPTHGQVEVWIDTKQEGTILLSVRDASGREVCRRKTNSVGSRVVEKFDLTTKPAGTYFVDIRLNPVPGSVSKRGAYRIVKL